MKKAIKDRIIQVINIFETGSKGGDYADISLLEDGPSGLVQVTYGRSQTTEFSNLNQLVEMYVERGGQYSKELGSYVGRIGNKPSLSSDSNFLNYLEKAGADPIMKATQNEFFDKVYWNPAYKFFAKNGFTLPLSMLVIYDSYIQGGLSIVRQKFGEMPPNKGGGEKAWIRAYVKARHKWLKYHKKTILNETIYRTQTFLDEIGEENWKLDKPMNVRGISV